MSISLLTSDKPLKARLKKVSEGKAELVLSDNQNIIISSKFLPSKAKIGDYLIVNLLSEEDLTKSKKQIAREVLQEILH